MTRVKLFNTITEMSMLFWRMYSRNALPALFSSVIVPIAPPIMKALKLPGPCMNGISGCGISESIAIRLMDRRFCRSACTAALDSRKTAIVAKIKRVNDEVIFHSLTQSYLSSNPRLAYHHMLAPHRGRVSPARSAHAIDGGEQNSRESASG